MKANTFRLSLRRWAVRYQFRGISIRTCADASRKSTLMRRMATRSTQRTYCLKFIKRFSKRKILRKNARWAWLNLFLFVVGSVAQAADPATSASTSYRWLRLYQYKHSGSHFRSSIEAPRFFYSSDGPTNPKAEFAAAIEAYSNPDRLFGTQKQRTFGNSLSTRKSRIVLVE